MIDRLQLPDGTYELALPMSGDMPIPMADLEADMGKWANALIEAPPGITLVGSTEQITWAEWLLLWAERNGVTARYRRTSPAEYSGRVEGISDAVAEEFQFVEQYGFVGGDPQAVYPDEVFVTLLRTCRADTDKLQLRQSGITIEESSIKNHITSCDWSSIL